MGAKMGARSLTQPCSRRLHRRCQTSQELEAQRLFFKKYRVCRLLEQQKERKRKDLLGKGGARRLTTPTAIAAPTTSAAPSARLRDWAVPQLPAGSQSLATGSRSLAGPEAWTQVKMWGWESWGRELVSWNLIQNSPVALAPDPELMLSEGRGPSLLMCCQTAPSSPFRSPHSGLRFLWGSCSCSLRNPNSVLNPSKSLSWELYQQLYILYLYVCNIC